MTSALFFICFKIDTVLYQQVKQCNPVETEPVLIFSSIRSHYGFRQHFNRPGGKFCSTELTWW